MWKQTFQTISWTVLKERVISDSLKRSCMKLLSTLFSLVAAERCHVIMSLLDVIRVVNTNKLFRCTLPVLDYFSSLIQLKMFISVEYNTVSSYVLYNLKRDCFAFVCVAG